MAILRRRLENSLRNKVCGDALHDYRVRSLQLNLHSDAGWPDRLFLTPYRPLWLEFKRLGDEPSPLQYQRLETLVNLGYIASVEEGWTSDYATAMERIQNALQRKR